MSTKRKNKHSFYQKNRPKPRQAQMKPLLNQNVGKLMDWVQQRLKLKNRSGNDNQELLRRLQGMQTELKAKKGPVEKLVGLTLTKKRKE